MKKAFLLLVLVCAAVSAAFAIPLEDLVDPGHAAQLRSDGGLIAETQLRNPAPKLLPRYAPLRQFVTEAQTALGPSLSVETLYIYKKSGPSGSWTDAQRTGLFNRLTALSTLTGIQYYSASRDSMRVFYESSRVLDGPQTKKPLSDPVFTAPPQSLTLYASQKDLTFGDNVYRYDYRTTPDAVFFVQENLTALNAGIVPAVGRNKLRSILAVIDCGDCLLIYAVSMAKAAALPGMGDRIGSSFGNRAEAVLKWFTAGADRVFAVN